VTTDEASVQSFEALLEYLQRTRGFDFTGYKRPTLMRRVSKRVEMLHLADYAEYLDYLEVHPEEFETLFNTILINVTAFFRDPKAWDFLQSDIVPRLLETRGPDAPLRVWSAGCASGEEAYTLAMVFAEALGPEAFQQRVKIYATDVDEEALAKARQAAYTTEEVRPVPDALREKYFEFTGGRYLFRPEFRRTVIFGRHDLVQDSPISRLDLIVCRNTLMYLNADTQTQVLARLHFALQERGFLFMGKSEMLLTHGELFAPVQSPHRVFA